MPRALRIASAPSDTQEPWHRRPLSESMTNSDIFRLRAADFKRARKAKRLAEIAARGGFQ